LFAGSQAEKRPINSASLWWILSPVNTIVSIPRLNKGDTARNNKNVSIRRVGYRSHPCGRQLHCNRLMFQSQNKFAGLIPGFFLKGVIRLTNAQAQAVVALRNLIKDGTIKADNTARACRALDREMYGLMDMVSEEDAEVKAGRILEGVI
jgi:hypothetical protein